VAGRHGLTAGLWLASILLLVLLVVRGGPWLWPRLFPAPTDTSVADPAGEGQAREPALVAELVHRTLVTLGAPGEGSDTLIELPRGATARDLELALRAEPGLRGTEIYVTSVDDLLWRLRVLEGGRVLHRRDVRPWLPERPLISGSDPPELGFVVLFEEQDDAAVRGVGGWKAPLALGLPAFAPHAVKSARQAAWSSKGVIVLIDPALDLQEQLLAAPEAGGVLLSGPLPAGVEPAEWLEPIDRLGLVLLDGSGGDSTAVRQAADGAGVAWARVVASLGTPEAEVLGLNLAVRRGHGIVTVHGTEEGLALLERFIDEARTDGYAIHFPVEVARLATDARSGSRLSAP
jgi:hypothetical protein